MLGLLEDAHALYVEAWQGRKHRLVDEHKTTLYSKHGAEEMEKHMKNTAEGGSEEKDGSWLSVKRGLKKSVSFVMSKVAGQ